MEPTRKHKVLMVMAAIALLVLGSVIGFLIGLNSHPGEEDESSGSRRVGSAVLENAALQGPSSSPRSG